MKKYGICLLVSAAVAMMAAAQDKPVTKWRFHSINSMGWIKGASATVFQLQTINGLRKKDIFLGLGVGTDHYVISGVPVFIDSRYYTGGRPSAFFLYGDAGIHVATTKGKPVNGLPGYDTRYLNGFYSDVGVGYAIGCGGRSAIELTAGWTYKRVTERITHWTQPIGAPEYENVDRYIYDFTRVSVKAGFRF